jgi:hypothetical protein
VSRYAGLIILALSFVIPPWISYISIAVLLVLRAVQIHGKFSRYLDLKSQHEVKEDWISSKVPILKNLKHLDLIICIFKVSGNSLLSFLMANVLTNGLRVIVERNYGEVHDL